MIILYVVPISLWPMLGKENRYIYTRKSTLSFELIILELFDCFTSLRVAGCLSAALKRQPNEAGNKYSELYTYFKLAKKISPIYLQK